VACRSEAGGRWIEIGAALGITKQFADAFHPRRIEDQERHLVGFHDAQRAHAVLGDEVVGGVADWIRHRTRP
jgi:hypothetical protein